MRTAMALLFIMPLVACEPDSIVERSGETLEDAGDDITDAIDEAREDVEEGIEEAAN